VDQHPDLLRSPVDQHPDPALTQSEHN